ncbi:ComEC/Rec2 family competence protein [Peteryoungia desertarenae]|uniref:ComEC/Rec2 family competence protein n=1 Tax=Peteryoungia desertarenae TaxID=1813451 RepID=A0ABX6QPG3_9HYPH|nr:ComEC/Rec2 family competence protein [Peteryoungia desertarenae]QLF70389.1 ComEC/Rec2 family competence protein [Peteryoungia desertarenae]
MAASEGQPTLKQHKVSEGDAVFAAALPIVSGNHLRLSPVRPAKSWQVAIRSILRPAALAACLREEWCYGHFFHFMPIMLGAGAITWFVVEDPPAIFLIAALIFIAASLLSMISAHVQPFRIILWALLFYLAGMAAAVLETSRLATTILDQALVTKITGIVERREAGSGGEWRYIVRLTSTVEPTIRRPPERVSLLARSSPNPVPIGGIISGGARLSPPSGSAVPGLNDFAFASYYQGIGAVGFFLGAPQALHSDVRKPANTGLMMRLDEAIFSLRDQISGRIRSIIPGDPGAFAAAIITGERRSMSNEATEALRLSGLAHITAISGLNMALAAGIFFVGFRSVLSLFPAVAQAYPVKKLAALGALIAITAYLMISGYQVSAVRAYLMTGMMLVAVLCDRPAISLRNLAIAGAVIIVITPSAALGPSFQMSFAATAALIAGYNLWQRQNPSFIVRREHPMRRTLAAVAGFVGGILLTSFIGGASTAIFSVHHFHRLSLHGLEANLAAMPLISMVVMPAGFVGMLLMPFGLDRPFFLIMGLGLELVLAVAHEVASWGDGVSFTRQPTWFLPVSVVGFLLLTLLRSRIRWLGGALMAATIACVWITPPPPTPDLVVAEDGTMVAVGTGDQTWATNRTRPPAFQFDQWQTALAVARHDSPLVLGHAPEPNMQTRSGRRKTFSPEQIRQLRAGIETNLASLADPRFTCYAGLCAIRLPTGWIVATVERPELIAIACKMADIVVSPTRWRYLECRTGVRLITANHLKQTGSLEIKLDEREGRVWSVRQTYEGRPKPWTQHRLYDWREDRYAQRHLPIDHLLSDTRGPTLAPSRQSQRTTAGAEFSDSDE